MGVAVIVRRPDFRGRVFQDEVGFGDRPVVCAWRGRGGVGRHGRPRGLVQQEGAVLKGDFVPFGGGEGEGARRRCGLAHRIRRRFRRKRCKDAERRR